MAHVQSLEKSDTYPNYIIESSNEENRKPCMHFLLVFKKQSKPNDKNL